MLTKIAIALAVSYVGSSVAISILEETTQPVPRQIPRPHNWAVPEEGNVIDEV